MTKMTKVYHDFYQHGQGSLKVTSMAADHDFLVLGGYNGEYVLIPSTSTQVLTGNITLDQNGITNHLTLGRTVAGG
jgi:hypothetical protein